MSLNFDPNQNCYLFNKKDTIPLVFIHGVGLDHQMWNYQVSYFNEYASFSEEQQSVIEKVSKDYQNWFAKNELPKIKTMLLQMKCINRENSKEFTMQFYDVRVK